MMLVAATESAIPLRERLVFPKVNVASCVPEPEVPIVIFPPSNVPEDGEDGSTG